MPSGYGPSRTIDDDPDLEAQSSVEHEMRSSSTGHGIVSSMLGGASHGETPERDEYEGGYLARAASSNGHSSHGHVTIHTRNSSLTQIYPSIRNTSPTLSRQVPNRARFSLSPERNPVPTAWNTSRSEAPTRRGSIDDMSTVSYNLHRVSSEPAIFHDGPQRISIYSRRQSSEYPRPEVFPHPGPPILIHTPPPNPPSSLLRPPSATQVPTLQTLQRSQPSGIYLDLPFVSEPLPSPGASTVSVLSGREGLLGTPPHHPTESLSSLRDDRDYSRRISVGVSVSCIFSIEIASDLFVAFLDGQRITRQRKCGRRRLRLGGAHKSRFRPPTFSVRVNLPFTVLHSYVYSSFNFPPYISLFIHPRFFT